MRWLAEAAERARALVFHARDEREMDEELRFHLEMEAARLEREEGIGPAEARRQAAIAFGHVEKHREEVREARGIARLTGFSLDLRLALRMMVRSPGLTVVSVLGMAVAIALTAGFFAFARALLYPELPLDEGERIVALENWDVRVGDQELRSLHDFLLWRAGMRTVTEIGAFRTVSRNLVTGEGPAEPVPVAEITAAGFTVPRVPPLLGRPLVAADERPGAEPVLVIGESAWRDRFGADPAIVGRTLRLGPTVHTVVGVMPERFAFPINHTYWTPLRLDSTYFARGESPEVMIFGRLAPGVSREGAQSELSALGREAADASPRTHAHLRPQVLPYTWTITGNQDDFWEIALLQGMMMLLLLVVAANVAVLVYARTAARRGEIAVRTALGASRRRVVGQLFLEALVLAAIAAALGMVLAQFGLRRIERILAKEPGGVPFWTDFGMDGLTLPFVLGLTLLTAVIVGVLPALGATGRQLQGSLRQLSGGAGMRLGRTWTTLIVGQVAVAVAALPAAVAMGWSQVGSASTVPTFPADRILAAWVALDVDPAQEADAEGITARYGARVGELMRRLEADPRVHGVTFTTDEPGGEPNAAVEVEGLAAPANSPAGHGVHFTRLDPALFPSWDVPLLAGRALTPADARDEADAVLVSRAFVRDVLGGGDAVGRRLRYAQLAAWAEPDRVGERWYQIVGVVDDLHRNRRVPDLPAPRVYHAGSLGALRPVMLAVRVREGDALGFAGTLRATAASVDPSLKLLGIRRLSDADLQRTETVRLFSLGVGSVILSVLLLSAAGIYALISFVVTQRRREIGIRAALGAQPARILHSIFARAAGQLGAGLAIGMACAPALNHLSGGEMLNGLPTVVLPAIAVLMTLVGLFAAAGPARRALRVQPMEALRTDA